MAYPQSADEYLAGLVTAIDAELRTGWPRGLDLELGLDIGIGTDPNRAALRSFPESRFVRGSVAGEEGFEPSIP